LQHWLLLRWLARPVPGSTSSSLHFSLLHSPRLCTLLPVGSPFSCLCLLCLFIFLYNSRLQLSFLKAGDCGGAGEHRLSPWHALYLRKREGNHGCGPASLGGGAPAKRRARGPGHQQHLLVSHHCLAALGTYLQHPPAPRRINAFAAQATAAGTPRTGYRRLDLRLL